MREALTAWFSWHRRTQLPDYADLLASLEADVLADTTAERVCAVWGTCAAVSIGASSRRCRRSSRIAMTLKPAQFTSIEERYAQSNAEYRDDFMQADPAKRARAMVKRTASRAEWLYGDLDRSQRGTPGAVRRRLRRSTRNCAYDERRRRQQDALRTLRASPTAACTTPAATTAIRAWLQRLDHSPREVYRVHAERLVQHNCRMAADLHNSTSAAQRQMALKKLRSWASDLRALALEVSG